ncbi:MAG: Cell division protein FtsZ [Bryobacteraceae bacterium]|nr:Cell division protein FtsZ [Bryobacteraceae bacterium]
MLFDEISDQSEPVREAGEEMRQNDSRMDALKFEIQDDAPAGTKIKVIGVGGGGCNAAGRMYVDGVKGVEFHAINTDRQALHTSPIPNRLLIGSKMTNGLGAGADPNVGHEAALEDTEQIIEILNGADMVFVAAGLGGGTGTGAAPVVASLAKELNALTVAVVTKPFLFEGARRMKAAEKGMAHLASTVDTLIQIPNERLTALMPRGTPLLDSFRVADDVLKQAVTGISDIMNTPGLINRDFSDIRAIMQGMGHAMMGTAVAKGEGAAMEAARKAINCPMLEEEELRGARGILINITGSSRISLHDINDACTLIRDAAQNEDVQVNFGIVIDERMNDEVKVTVIATGFPHEAKVEPFEPARGVFEKPAEQAMMPEGAAEPSAVEPLPVSSAAPMEEPVEGVGEAGEVSHDEPAKVVEEVDVPAFLRRGRRSFF